MQSCVDAQSQVKADNWKDSQIVTISLLINTPTSPALKELWEIILIYD
jgi:hypothetical protein